MSTYNKVLLILGYGSNIGQNTARAFQAAGYEVAIAARSIQAGLTAEGYLAVPVDLSQPEDLRQVFESVKEKFGFPTVILYNAAAAPFARDGPLSLDTSTLTRSLAINTISPYFAAQQGLANLSNGKIDNFTFLYTGNALNTSGGMLPAMAALGMGKSATFHWLEAAAASSAQTEGSLKDKAKYYYVDERLASGAPPGHDINGSAHAQHFMDLVEAENQGPIQSTFVAGKGYTQFHKFALS